MSTEPPRRSPRFRLLPVLAVVAFGGGAYFFINGFLNVHHAWQYFLIGSILQGFLSLFLGVFTTLFEGLDARLTKWMNRLRTNILLLIIVGVGFWGAHLAQHAQVKTSVDSHTIAILANIIPSLSAMLAVATKFDYTFPSPRRDNVKPE